VLWHYLDRENVPEDWLFDIYDGLMWKEWSKKKLSVLETVLNKEERMELEDTWFSKKYQYSLSFALNGDGFQPFTHTVYGYVRFLLKYFN
jgi:hypothetical protein